MTCALVRGLMYVLVYVLAHLVRLVSNLVCSLVRGLVVRVWRAVVASVDRVGHNSVRWRWAGQLRDRLLVCLFACFGCGLGLECSHVWSHT